MDDAPATNAARTTRRQDSRDNSEDSMAIAWRTPVVPMPPGHFGPGPCHRSFMRNPLPALLFSAATCLLAGSGLAQNVLYVSDTGGRDSNTGTSRLQPLKNLRTALARARSNLTISEIRVKYGTHTPGPMRSSTFLLRSNLRIEGGYNANFLTQSLIFPTILSGKSGTQARRPTTAASSSPQSA